MQKVINGKRYNTETATLIADWANHHNYGDFSHCTESLYITKKGSFFIAGEGGAMSKYAKSYGNNSTGGSEDITVLTKEEAQAWCEEHDVDVDTIAQYFTLEDA